MNNIDKSKNLQGLTEEEFLNSYNPGDYERPSVTVDMLLLTVGEKPVEDVRKLPEKELKILLIKRKDHPYINHWAIPGGFVNIGENIEDAVYRELKEETNIDNVYLEQLYTWGDVNRDPRMRVISTSYMALVNEKELKPQAGDDANDVKWFSVKKEFVSQERKGKEEILTYNLIFSAEDMMIGYLVIERNTIIGFNTKKELTYEPLWLSQEKLAFDHAKIIDYALERLKNKIEYTPIAFSLLPKYFTLSELQSIYEVILGKQLTKPNFRRDIAPMVIETERKADKGGHRPAKYFKYNENWKHEF